MTVTDSNGSAQRAGARVSQMFREVNTRIREAAGRAGGDDPWDFICECDDLECAATVSLTIVDYDARRVLPGSRIVVEHAG
ncbi:MAG TPA: hypothetical protein VGF23_06495 [Gaiellaceae bacterium]|jgi:hypothetical protein